MTALHDLSIAEAGRRLRDGSLTSKALTEHALARAEAFDPKIHAFITITRERALADADAADRDFARGVDRGPLQGIPHALKDIYDTAGILTSCHSKLRQTNVPKQDSAVAARFAAQGAVLIGKLSTHEFALGGPSFDLPWPPARNPWNQDHITGGSSSGSGAAVSSGIVRVAMGSDTGGSIRGPAAYCGTVGIKPTFGLVSRRGVFPLAHSLDHCGPLAWSVMTFRNSLVFHASDKVTSVIVHLLPSWVCWSIRWYARPESGFRYCRYALDAHGSGGHCEAGLRDMYLVRVRAPCSCRLDGRARGWRRRAYRRRGHASRVLDRVVGTYSGRQRHTSSG